MKKIFYVFFAVLYLSFSQVQAGIIADFLIINDIGQYKLEKPFISSVGLVIGGGEPKESRDGNDAEGFYTSYTVGYDGGKGHAGPDVEVRVYDSTQWILHDLEREHKTFNDSGVALKTDRATTVKNINNNVVSIIRIGGRAYFWISDNKIISIEYSDSHFEYPVPIEVLNEYLNKYPSTLPSDYQVRKRDTEWVKEEFDRLLRVSERWVSLIQEADPKQAEKLTNAAENLEDFAQYRKVYFEDDMEKDIEFLQTSHMRPAQDEFVRAKLAEYQDWWASHKDDSISFP